MRFIEFAGLHIDPRVIGQKNSLIQGEHIRRKNGCIVNTGAKLTRDEIRRKISENKEMYELPEEEWSTIELPLPEDPQLCKASAHARYAGKYYMVTTTPFLTLFFLPHCLCFHQC
jgi:hypothetical protein